MFTLDDLRNLKGFMSRVQMKANEAQLFVDLSRKIDQNIVKLNNKEVQEKKNDKKS